MKLIEFLSNHSVNYALINGYLTMFLIAAIAFIIWQYLRLKEAKTWIKFTDIEKRQNRSELTEEKLFLEIQGNMYSKLLLRHSELKQGFEDAVAEITELRLKDKNNFSYIQELINDKDKLKIQITYWKERSLHQKHTKKVVESDYWECTKEIENCFIKGNKYKQIKDNKNFILWGEGFKQYWPDKKYFKPVQK